MSLDINGYNATFKAFTDFAQAHIAEKDGKTIADAQFHKPAGGLKTVAIDVAQGDSVHKWTRGIREWTVNDRTRDIFKNAIANMFGGETKIPASVKKAMLLGDYNAGKPLTARRILAVKAAIDADGTAAARAAKIRLETFSPEVETAALALGYSKKELPTIARAAHFLATATGKSEMEAMREVATYGSKAARLMSYGGRFMENAANFADGLRLMDLFAAWHEDLCTSAAAIANTGVFEQDRDYSSADTPSKLNADHNTIKPKLRRTMEKFVFEQLAVDPSANLKETDGEKIFGFENNDASRFVGQGFTHSCVNTLGNIPPAKRAVVYKVFNLFCSLAENADVHKRPAKERYLVVGNRTNLMGRILKNLDKILALDAKGQLTAKNVVKTCFPDMVAAKATGNYDLKAVTKFYDAMDAMLPEAPEDGGYSDIAGPLALLMEATGCTVKEGADSLRNGKPLAVPQYISPGQMPFGEFETLEGGRNMIEADLYRPANYSIVGGQQDILPEDAGFGFNFPGEKRFVTNGSPDGRANMTKVGDKVEEMCGPTHIKQASSVMLMLSQSGLGILNKGLKPYGVISSEHSVVDYTLSKNAETGDVTIKYSSPEGLPFRFEWTATVDVDGMVTTTPLKFEKQVEMNVGVATKYVEDAAKRLGVNLTNTQKSLATVLVARYGTNMYDQNARLFAGFIVQLRLTDSSAERDLKRAEDTAKSIREWRSFGFDDDRLAQFNEAAKAQVQDTINGYLSPAKANNFKNNIHETFIADAQRSVYTLNGKTYAHRPTNEVVDAFKALVPNPKAQKTLSSYMNQLCFETLLPVASHIPFNTGVNAIKLPGAGAIANRDMLTELYTSALLSTKGHDAIHDLRISPDGRTAVITQTISASFASPYSDSNNPSHFGSATFTQRIVLDLSQEEPVVTDYKLSQTINTAEVQPM